MKVSGPPAAGSTTPLAHPNPHRDAEGPDPAHGAVSRVGDRPLDHAGAGLSIWAFPTFNQCIPQPEGLPAGVCCPAGTDGHPAGGIWGGPWPFPQGPMLAPGRPGRPVLAHGRVLRTVCYLCKILCCLPRPATAELEAVLHPQWHLHGTRVPPVLGPGDPSGWHSPALLPFEPCWGVSLVWG